MSEAPSPKPRGILPATPLEAGGLIEYQEGSVISRVLLKRPSGNVTLFAFDQGEGLSEHKAPYDALVHILEGQAAITVSGERHEAKAGELILLPANEPHALEAIQPFKMILTMVKS
jgi:quercetin dioxygenase-like cupin family protein